MLSCWQLLEEFNSNGWSDDTNFLVRFITVVNIQVKLTLDVGFQLPSPKPFGFRLQVDEWIQPRLVFNYLDGFINCRHSRFILPNLYQTGRWNRWKLAKTDGSQNNHRLGVFWFVCINRNIRKIRIVEFFQGNYAVWRRYSQCFLLLDHICVGSSFLHRNMAVDVYLCLQHEEISHKPANEWEKFSHFRVVGVSSLHGHWNFKFILSWCRVRRVLNKRERDVWNIHIIF